MAEVQTTDAQTWYEKQVQARAPFLDRAREVAKLTIPHLMPPEGDVSGQKFTTPYQSVGARGTNNLTAAIVMAMLPSNSPLFRLILNDKAKNEVEGVKEVSTEISKALAEMERATQREIETRAIRTSLHGAVKHSIVSGNALMFVPVEGPIRTYHLDRFVISRDPMDNVRRIVIKEDIAKDLVPADISTAETPSDVEVLSLYTSITTTDNKTVEVYQEIAGQRVGGSDGSYPRNLSPYIHIRINRVDGEAYGRGYAEEYLGDLESLEGLTQSIVEGSAASAKLLFMVKPNSATRKNTVAASANGAIIDGDADDVTVLQTGKHADFSVALATINKIEERLSYAFMLTEAAIRKAERVTAEEVRMVTQALERQLGGVYSLMANEFQLPLVEILMARMTRAGKLPALPKGLVMPIVVTGVEAIGRGNDLNKLDSLIAGIGQMLGPEAIKQYVNVSEYLGRRAAALGIEVDKLIYSEEELAAAAQQAQNQQTMETLGPTALKAGVDSANNTENLNAREGA